MEDFSPFLLIAVFIVFLVLLKKSIATQKKSEFGKQIPEDSIFRFNSTTTNNVVGKSYAKKEYYVSIAERSLYEKIQRYLPGEYVIFPQVLLSSITKPNCDKKDFWLYQNKINRKTIDFVIFDKHYLTPVLAIELDGVTHEWKNRQTRDEFVDAVLDSSGIKIIHVKYDPRNEYRVEESQIINFINQYHPLQAQAV